jgi:hypothetical protein
MRPARTSPTPKKRRRGWPSRGPRAAAAEAAVANREAVHHPAHYGGADNPYEAIKVIDAWRLGFALGNAVKYIARAGKKDPAKTIEDLEKARFYLDYEIAQRKAGAK